MDYGLSHRMVGRWKHEYKLKSKNLIKRNKYRLNSKKKMKTEIRIKELKNVTTERYILKKNSRIKKNLHEKAEVTPVYA
jgi:hypothetical protein